MRVIYGSQVLHEVALLIDDTSKGTNLSLLSGYFEPQERLGVSILRALERGVRVNLVVRGGRSRGSIVRRHRRSSTRA
jgi:hypothetical protein